MVVDERAVQTWFIFSSADPVIGMLTRPRVARPIVHLFTFILILSVCLVLLYLMFLRDPVASGTSTARSVQRVYAAWSTGLRFGPRAFRHAPDFEAAQKRKYILFPPAS